jgi:diguanylate cyclase (GGDEF)-like protein
MPNVHPEPKRPPLSRLATKILLFVVLSTLTTSLAVSWISVRSSQDQLRLALERAYPAEISRAVPTVRGLMEGAARELRRFSHHPAITDSFSRETPARRAAADELASRSEFFSGFAVIDRKRTIRLAIGGARGLPEEALSRLPDLDSRPPWSLPTTDSGLGPVLAVPIGNVYRPAGALLGTLRPALVREALARAGPSEATARYLLDSEGRVLVGSGSGETRAGVDLSRLAASQPVLRDYDDEVGEPVLGGAVPLGLYGWDVAVEVTIARAFEPAHTVVGQTFAIGLIIVVLMRKQVEIDATSTKLQKHNAALEQANEVLSQLSITDGLTKLHNHRYFQDFLTREIKRVNRAHEPLSMLVIDIDDFKGLNDRFGHAAGDEFLAGMARILMKTARETDLLARYGGEEFVVLCSDTDLEGAYALAEKIRTAIQESSFILDESMRPTRATVSIGVAQFNGNRSQFFKAADRALYRAKDQGKNCVIRDEE